MGKMHIEGLKVPALIGVHAYEKKEKQILSVDVCFSIDIDRAARQDALSDTINYTEVRNTILNFSSQTHFCLLETFVKNLSDHLKSQFQFTELELSVTKFPKDLPDLSGVKLTVKTL